MQIQLEREALLKPVTTVASVVERRQTLPILAYMLVQASGQTVSVTGTDLEVEVVATIGAQVEKPGEVTVPARKLFDICRALPEGVPVSLVKQAEKVVLKAGKSRFTLSSLPSADFPRIEGGSFEQALTISSRLLKVALERTAFCMAQQDVRYYLNGLYLEVEEKRLRAVATDGHRMAITDIECDSAVSSPVQLIIPRKAVQEMGRFLTATEDPVRLEIGANHIRLAVEGFVFTSKLIDGKFPDYTKVIPNNQSKLIHLDRHIFREALGRVAILANEKYRGVRLNLENRQLQVSAHNPEQEEAVEEVETSYEGEPIEIGFNVSYLIEAAGALDSQDIVLGLNDSSSSCTLRAPDDTHTQYIVMPMRL